jgi:multiple sugar transport system permease protein
LGLFTFSNTWNDFIWPLITTNTDAMRTVQLGLSTFRGINYTEQTLFMAGTSLAMIPVMVLFLIGQRYFIRGIALSGIKG